MDKLDEHAEISPIVVWINGVCGIGKTSVCEKLSERLDYCTVIFSDEYPDDFGWSMIIQGGGGNPQTNTVLAKKIRERIEQALAAGENRFVVVDMAITTTMSKDLVYDYIRNQEPKDIHFILTAKEEKCFGRIKDDENRKDNKHAIYNYSSYLGFLDSHYEEAIRIDTTDMGIDEVVERIINEIRIFQDQRPDKLNTCPKK